METRITKDHRFQKKNLGISLKKKKKSAGQIGVPFVATVSRILPLSTQNNIHPIPW
jgi:hypothetical protein